VELVKFHAVAAASSVLTYSNLLLTQRINEMDATLHLKYLIVHHRFAKKCSYVSATR
jgi:5-carboxymethyl-2-hydroxymuconate isomerase